jgi:3-methyl-2-oxobutanoate hydroxymethyltransferase
VSDAGMAVMAHIGIRPQSVGKVGRFKAEASTTEMAVELVNLAEQMVNSGATALLLEGVCAEVAKIITEKSEVPVISCGSGPDCDGQILIAPDILGLATGPAPKFVKNFGKLAETSIGALTDYAKQVRQGNFPDAEHCYHMKQGELDRLRKMLG